MKETSTDNLGRRYGGMEQSGRRVVIPRKGQILGCILIMGPIGLAAELNVAC